MLFAVMEYVVAMMDMLAFALMPEAKQLILLNAPANQRTKDLVSQPTLAQETSNALPMLMENQYVSALTLMEELTATSQFAKSTVTVETTHLSCFA